MSTDDRALPIRAYPSGRSSANPGDYQEYQSKDTPFGSSISPASSIDSQKPNEGKLQRPQRSRRGPPLAYRSPPPNARRSSSQRGTMSARVTSLSYKAAGYVKRSLSTSRAGSEGSVISLPRPRNGSLGSDTGSVLLPVADARALRRTSQEQRLADFEAAERFKSGRASISLRPTAASTLKQDVVTPPEKTDDRPVVTETAPHRVPSVPYDSIRANTPPKIGVADFMDLSSSSEGSDDSTLASIKRRLRSLTRRGTSSSVPAQITRLPRTEDVRPPLQRPQESKTEQADERRMTPLLPEKPLPPTPYPPPVPTRSALRMPKRHAAVIDIVSDVHTRSPTTPAYSRVRALFHSSPVSLTRKSTQGSEGEHDSISISDVLRVWQDGA